MIIKTFILSQICYTVRCFKPSHDTLAKLEDMICNFINYGRDNFSRSNIFKPLAMSSDLVYLTLRHFVCPYYKKNCSRAINTNQPWALILKSNFKFNLLDRVQIDNIV